MFIIAKQHGHIDNQPTDLAVKPEDVQRLSPLLLDHINVLGRYEFVLKESIRKGKLRPLREPKEMNDLAA